MTCDRCQDLQDLQDEVRSLRRELAYEFDRDRWIKLGVLFHLTQHEAAVVCGLAQVKGRVLPGTTLAALLPPLKSGEREDDSIIPVLVHRIRLKVGRDAIENVWGHGYRASASLLAKSQSVDAQPAP